MQIRQTVCAVLAAAAVVALPLAPGAQERFQAGRPYRRKRETDRRAPEILCERGQERAGLQAQVA